MTLLQRLILFLVAVTLITISIVTVIVLNNEQNVQSEANITKMRQSAMIMRSEFQKSLSEAGNIKEVMRNLKSSFNMLLKEKLIDNGSIISTSSWRIVASSKPVMEGVMSSSYDIAQMRNYINKTPDKIWTVVPSPDGRLLNLYTPIVIGSGANSSIRFFAKTSMESSAIEDAINAIIQTMIYIVALIILINAGVAVVLSRMMVGPIRELQGATQEVSSGNLETHVDVKSEDELGHLSHNFNIMTDKIKAMTEEIKSQLDELQKWNRIMQGQLDLAETVQAAQFPGEAKGDMIHIFGKTIQHDQVGGDFFDYVLLKNKNIISFIILDVTGHGIPAALVIMYIKNTFMRIVSRYGNRPDILGSKINDVYFEMFNPLGIFGTALFGAIDLEEMEFKFASSGHNDFVVVWNNGKAEPWSGEKGFMLGLMDGIELPLNTLDLTQVDKMYHVTDGIYETKVDGVDYEEYFAPRLEESNNMDLQDIVTKIMSQVQEGEVDDDLTMVAFSMNSAGSAENEEAETESDAEIEESVEGEPATSESASAG